MDSSWMGVHFIQRLEQFPFVFGVRCSCHLRVVLCVKCLEFPLFVLSLVLAVPYRCHFSVFMMSFPILSVLQWC